MLFSELLEQLSNGELSDRAIGGKGSGGIKESDYPQIVLYLNAGLKDLHTRLPLRFEEIFVEQQTYIQDYLLSSKFALTNTESLEPVKYIIDSVYQPFKDNIIKIEQVFSEGGDERSINNPSDIYSVYTPKFNTVSIPFNDEENTFSVIYRANHEKIIITDDFDPEQVEIDIPQWLEDTLMVYIAGRVIGNVSSADNLNTSTYYSSRYELSLQDIERHSLLNTAELYNNRLERNGWV